MIPQTSRYITALASRELAPQKVKMLERSRTFMFDLGHQTQAVYLVSFDAQLEGLEHLEQFMTVSALEQEPGVRICSNIGNDAIWEEYLNTERIADQFCCDAGTAASLLQADWDRVKQYMHLAYVGETLVLGTVVEKLISYLQDIAQLGLAVDLLDTDFITRPSLTLRVFDVNNLGINIYIDVRWRNET